MEPQDQKDQDQQQGSGSHEDQDRNQNQRPDSPQKGEHTPRSNDPEAPQVIGTDAPIITKGPAFQSDWASEPDRIMVVQTNRIREPNEAFHSNFVMVPIEPDRPAQDRSGGGNGEGKVTEGEQGKGQQGKGGNNQGGQEGDTQKAKAQSNGKQDQDDEQKGSGEGAKRWLGQSGQSPSLTKILLYAGAVALVCGVVGAWGYSYFFGSDKSGDEKSSSKSSGSSKGGSSKGGSSKGGSSEGSNSSQSSDSSHESDSSQEARTRKNSTSNEKNSGAGKLVEAELAWLAAVKELHQAQEAEKTARASEEEKKAILDFLKTTLLSAGRPGSMSLTEAFWTAGKGQDVTLRKAVDVTESQVGEAFTDRPLAEASVREMLGLAYLSLGDAAQAVKEYERAFALREAMQGLNHPDAAACRNQLAVAYRLAGRAGEGGRLFERDLNSPARAAALAVRGSVLLREKKFAEAELKLRECLAMRQKIQPDDWVTFDTESLLGQALVEQRKFAESEPRLVAGYEGMKQREDKIPPQDKHHLIKALERLVSFYEAWGQVDKASAWRKVLEQTEIATKPDVSPKAP
jgi:tetratricopeptide (TPR) repeat protein